MIFTSLKLASQTLYPNKEQLPCTLINKFVHVFIQMVSNAIYKSVEHRVMVNSEEERVSIAFFYNPRGDMLIGPAKELVTPARPAFCKPVTWNEYRLILRKQGLHGKAQVDSLKPSWCTHRYQYSLYEFFDTKDLNNQKYYGEIGCSLTFSWHKWVENSNLIRLPATRIHANNQSLNKTIQMRCLQKYLLPSINISALSNTDEFSIMSYRRKK